jgi:hypothetical protein
MTAREHAKLLGLLFWIYVGLQALMSVFAAFMVSAIFGTMASEFAKMPHRPNEPNPEAFFGMITTIMICAFVIGFLFLIPKTIAAYGLRNEKSWAKIWAIIACCLAVLSFPLGTALGVYGFWFIFGDEGKRYFGGSSEPSPMSAPPPNNWQ